MSLSTIDGQIQDLHNLIRAQEATIRALKQQHNDLVPIARLPTELLELIFTIVCESSYHSYHHGRFYPRWVYLSFVCRHWRAVALGYPRLWSRIDDLPYKWLFEFIERSAPGPIDVSINADLHGMYPMKRLAGKGLPRMRRLAMKGHGATIQKILPLLNAPAPMLEVLSIDSSDDDPYMPRFHIHNSIFGHHAPLLREIRLGPQIALDPESPLISDRLEVFDSLGGMRVSDVRKILSRTPNLLSLECNSYSSTSSPTKEPQPIVLTRLSILTVDAFNMEGLMSLIVNLSLPALETLSIRILTYNFHSLAQDADIAQISSLMQARPPRSLRLVPALSQGVHIYAWDTENMGVVKNLQGAGRANTTLSFKARDHARLVPDFHMMRFYRILCTGLPLADVCTLTLEIDHTFTAAEWTEMLAPLVRVTTLKLIGRKMIPALLLAATPRPTSLLHPRAAPELLFPALELIIITQLYLRATPSSPSLNILLGNRALPELADARRRIGRPLRVAFEDCPRYSDALAKAMEGVAETSWDNAGIWDDRRCEEAWCGNLFELETL